MNEPIEDHLDRPDDIPPRRSGRVGALLRRARRVLLWGLFAVVLLFLVWGSIYRWVNPPITFYMMQERARLGEIQYQWIDIEEVSPMLRRAVVAAEDANFCTHWGIDSAAVRQALREGRCAAVPPSASKRSRMPSCGRGEIGCVKRWRLY